ncbi:MAG: alpha/beta fold hydrolase [Burkholderiales bacterium]
MNTNRETVLLLHGLWMNHHVMTPLAMRLSKAGFATRGVSFASMRASLDENAALVTRELASLAGAVHIVAHSYGGVVTLRALAMTPNPLVKRIVLLGSPVGGSVAGAIIAARPTLARLLGTTRTVWAASPRLVVPPAVDVGAIAGTTRIGLGRFFVDLPQPNDGVVVVEETRLPGLTDHLTLATSHSTMLVSARVARHVEAFLRTGRFRLEFSSGSI